MKHGLYVNEQATGLSVTTARETVICAIGTAPINMLEDPQSAVNTPILATTAAEGMQMLGYSNAPDSEFSLDNVLYLQNLRNVANVVYINVLDPAKHKTEFDEQRVDVADLQAVVPVKGIIRDTVTVKAGDTELVPDEDYTLAYDADNTLLVNLTLTGRGADATTLTVTGSRLDPAKATALDVVGSVNPSTGAVTGLEVVNQVLSATGLVPTILIAPGYSQDPDVTVSLAAKAESISSQYAGIALVDLDDTAATAYTKAAGQKEAQGATGAFSLALWPSAAGIGTRKVPYSANLAMNVAAADAANGGIPYISPSNTDAEINGMYLSDGTPVLLTLEQANVLNAAGICTAINHNGWRTWGNYTAAYPLQTDPKDVWIPCRRMMNWYRNRLMTDYWTRVDQPMSKRNIEMFLDQEQIAMGALVSQGYVAGFDISYSDESNPITDIISGKITFTVRIAFFTPMQDIEFNVTFDTDLLQASLAA